MKCLPQGCAAHVISDSIGNVNAMLADEMRAQGQIQIINVGEEIGIRRPTQQERLAPVEHKEFSCSSTSPRTIASRFPIHGAINRFGLLGP